MSGDNTERILRVVCQIPCGSVATYGQIARIAGIPRNSRQVGAVLKSQTPGMDIPWFRVVNSRGEISTRGRPESEDFQRNILENENIEFDKNGRISLKTYGWEM